MCIRDSQIRLHIRSKNEADVYLFLPIFRRGKKLGTLYLNEQLFRTVKKDRNNLFHLFKNRKRTSGIAINNEVLTKLKFQYIEVPFESETLKTTKEHFISTSIPSPFENEKVDFQKVLQIKDFYIPKPKDVQEKLFAEEGK